MILYEPIQNNFKYLIQTRKTSRNSNSPFHVGPDKGLCIKYVGRGAGGPAKLKILLILAKTLQKQKSNFSRSALYHKKTRVSLKYLVSDCVYY